MKCLSLILFLAACTIGRSQQSEQAPKIDIDLLAGHYEEPTFMFPDEPEGEEEIAFMDYGTVDITYSKDSNEGQIIWNSVNSIVDFELVAENGKTYLIKTSQSKEKIKGEIEKLTDNLLRIHYSDPNKIEIYLKIKE